MNMITNCLNSRKYEISKYAEIVEILLISLIVLLTPVIVPQLLNIVFGAQSVIAQNSQYVVGSLVNIGLIVSAINVKGWKKVISIITLPSISAIFSGLIFQSASIFTVYMIPAIWIGNFTLVYLFKYLYVNKKINYIAGAVPAVAAKVAIIFAGFNFEVLTNIIPKGAKAVEVLKIAMGMNQLITAVIGSIIAFAFVKLVYKENA